VIVARSCHCRHVVVEGQASIEHDSSTFILSAVGRSMPATDTEDTADDVGCSCESFRIRLSGLPICLDWAADRSAGTIV